MRVLPVLSLALMLAAVPHPAPAAVAAPIPAQPGTSPDAPYFAVLDAIESGLDQEAAFRIVARTIATELARSSPEMIEAEANYPGLSDALTQSILPTLRQHSQEVQAKYRPQLAAALKQQFTPQQAKDVAVFYRSPIGRKLMHKVEQNYDGRATVTAAMREKDVALADVQADNRVMISRSLRELTQADLAELGRLAKAKPHLLKLNAAAQAMAPIRVRMENEPMRPEIEAQMLADMETAAKDFVAHARAAQGLPPAPEPEVDPAPALDAAGKPLPRT